MNSNYILTNKERAVMAEFWNSDTPLSSVDLLERLKEEFEYPTQLHRVLNQLLDRKLIEVCGLVISGKKNMRQFHPTISEEKFTEKLLHREIRNKKTLAKVAVALVGDVTENLNDEAAEKEFIESLEQMIREYKKSAGK